jgi:hypothetical protein
MDGLDGGALAISHSPIAGLSILGDGFDFMSLTARLSAFSAFDVKKLRKC